MNISFATPPIDSHAHVFTRRLPMLPKRRYTPTRDATPASYWQNARAAGVDGALLVQPSFLGTDNSYLAATLQRAPATRGVATLSPRTSRKQVAALATGGFIGARLNLTGRRAPDLRSEQWQRHLRLIDSLNWHLEICAESERLQALLPAALKHCRRVVIDHFGLPTTGESCLAWRRALAGGGGRLWVKVSAPYRVFPHLPLPVAVDRCSTLAGILRDAIGDERILWGSDWPWTQHEAGISYSMTMQWREQWLDNKEDGARALLAD